MGGKGKSSLWNGQVFAAVFCQSLTYETTAMCIEGKILALT